MARTLVQIKKQIEALENEAESVRANEVAGVIQRIKTAIEFYELTVQDLFSVAIKFGVQGKTSAKLVKNAKKLPAPVKFQDKETGKTWTGHGKRPGWFVKAIENGVAREDLAI